MSLDGTVALVTGATRGVGLGIATELGAAGATVYVTGRSTAGDRTEGLPGTVEGAAEAVSEAGGEGIGVVCDHRDDEAVAGLFDRVEAERGRLDLLVNNAWGGYEGYGEDFDDPFWDQPVSRWDAMFDVGVRAAFVASRAAVPRLSEGGLIVSISSGDGDRYRGSVPYDVAKTAVDRLGKAMALDLEAEEVASVVLHPGFTRTERVVEAFEEAGDPVPEETHSPAYVGRAVVALAGDSAVLARSGGVFAVGDLAREYGFTDVDGDQPPAFRLDTPEL